LLDDDGDDIGLRFMVTSLELTMMTTTTIQPVNVRPDYFIADL
jgi:hypothetical protein